MTFNVTEREIRNGIRESYTHNPVATCIRKTFNKERHIHVKVEIFQLDYVFIDGHTFELPLQPQVLLKKFHGGKQVNPIVFDIQIPNDMFGEGTY